MMELNDYTKKIIKGLAIGSAVAGVLLLTVGIYSYHPIFMLGGFSFFGMAYMGYGVATSRYDSRNPKM